MSREIKVVFQPLGRVVYALPGTVLMEAAARAGIILRALCGGAGTCGKCVVRVLEGDCPATEPEIRQLGSTRIASGYRLACCAALRGPLRVEVPQTSLFEQHTRILVKDQGANAGLDVAPAIRKTLRRPDYPQHDGANADLDRLLHDLPVRRIRIEALRTLPEVLRRCSGSALTVVQVDDDLIAVEPGDTTGLSFGLAFDVGTTTLVGTLMDLTTGVEMDVTARVNPQTFFGDDVISRIQICRDDPDGFSRLRSALMEAINAMIEDLLARQAVSKEHVYRVVLAGNSTMQQIVCGIDPSALGELPFTPAFNRGLETDAAAIGLDVLPVAHVFVFPQPGGFVGGDTVAGILAAGLADSAAPSMLVDIGTNGEIVLAHDGLFAAASVAAGPAFEGARIVRGMRAAAGAIEKVMIGDDGDILINVIGDSPAVGLCGTALIDAVAELLRCGVIEATGRILPHAELPAGISPALRSRVIDDQQGQTAIILAKPSETPGNQPLCLYQQDVRELQLATAAIRAGIILLLRRSKITPEDLSSLLLAGAFGNYIRRDNAVRIGMLPALAPEKIGFIGNAASLGAKRALLSNAEKEVAHKILRRTTHVDLSLDPEFQHEFSAAMLFPEC